MPEASSINIITLEVHSIGGPVLGIFAASAEGDKLSLPQVGKSFCASHGAGVAFVLDVGCPPHANQNTFLLAGSSTDQLAR